MTLIPPPNFNLNEFLRFSQSGAAVIQESSSTSNRHIFLIPAFGDQPHAVSDKQTIYMFIQIIKSLDYDNEYIGISTGIAYSREAWSFTFGINDANVIQSGDTEEALEDLTQYGTLTFAWQL